MPVTPRQTFRCNEETWKRFMARCAARGYTATDVLKSFIVAVADGAASPDAYHPKKHPRARELSDNAVLNWLKGKKPESGN